MQCDPWQNISNGKTIITKNALSSILVVFQSTSYVMYTNSHPLFISYLTYPSWWFQPIWKILVKMDIFPKIGVKINNIWKHLPVSTPYLLLPSISIRLFWSDLPRPRLWGSDLVSTAMIKKSTVLRLLGVFSLKHIFWLEEFGQTLGKLWEKHLKIWGFLFFKTPITQNVGYS